MQLHRSGAMSVPPSCSKPVFVSSNTPRLDLLDIAYVYEEEKAKLPTIFSRKHYSSVPNQVTLTDPTGHDFQVAVLKDQVQTYFGSGWKDVGAFYGIKAGGWVRMFYVSHGHFSINVFNQWGDPVKYEPPTRLFAKGDSSHPIMLDEDPDMMYYLPNPNIVDLSLCLSEFKKCLSYEEIVGHKLCFGKTWTAYALRKDDGYLTIVDEYGYTWPCFFQHNLLDANKSGISSGWSSFCHNKKLFQAQCVKFGVLRINSSVLYFTPSF